MHRRRKGVRIEAVHHKLLHGLLGILEVRLAKVSPHIAFAHPRGDEVEKVKDELDLVLRAVRLLCESFDEAADVLGDGLSAAMFHLLQEAIEVERHFFACLSGRGWSLADPDAAARGAAVLTRSLFGLGIGVRTRSSSGLRLV